MDLNIFIDSSNSPSKVFEEMKKTNNSQNERKINHLKINENTEWVVIKNIKDLIGYLINCKREGIDIHRISIGDDLDYLKDTISIGNLSCMPVNTYKNYRNRSTELKDKVKTKAELRIEDAIRLGRYLGYYIRHKKSNFPKLIYHGNDENTQKIIFTKMQQIISK